LGQDELATLANNPAFLQLRGMIRQNPTLLPAFLQQLGQSNPALLQLINDNPEQFTQFMMGGDGGGEGAEQGDLAAALEEMGAGGGGAGTIQVTPEENAAIERLAGMGFPRDIVIQAFLACDRNEELAANYLFENGRDSALPGCFTLMSG
jgi:UV excision repair protein RAD23